jgi:hypothetical protein
MVFNRDDHVSNPVYYKCNADDMAWHRFGRTWQSNAAATGTRERESVVRLLAAYTIVTTNCKQNYPETKAKAALI